MPRTMRQIRRERDVTQRAIADALGVTDAAVSAWERGENRPPLAVARQIARILGVSLDEIVFPGEQKRPNEPAVR